MFEEETVHSDKPRNKTVSRMSTQKWKLWFRSKENSWYDSDMRKQWHKIKKNTRTLPKKKPRRNCRSNLDDAYNAKIFEFEKEETKKEEKMQKPGTDKTVRYSFSFS